ncbi:transposase-like protein [Breznakia pachnodae]|uniref:Transposase-like protein n=1 Tax=Breznakia pachnodae TaxID=265178 RepID=A0ABU0E579_9FIRM|nr:transposase-like protein [Breznakia pachnodae]
MSKERYNYIQAESYVLDEEHISQRNDYYECYYTPRVGTIELIVPTRDGIFAPTIFEKYQRNEKALLYRCWKYILKLYQLKSRLFMTYLVGIGIFKFTHYSCVID